MGWTRNRAVQVLGELEAAVVLIIDDADKWGSSPDAEQVEPRAQALFTTALQPLLAADFHLIVAVQDHWPALPAYENLAKRLADTITIPEFTPDAASALRQIIARDADIPPTGAAGVDGLLDDAALARIEAEYGYAERDLRQTLRILRGAVRDAARRTPVPDRLGHQEMINPGRSARFSAMLGRSGSRCARSPT
jgi:hypothetical protein